MPIPDGGGFDPAFCTCLLDPCWQEFLKNCCNCCGSSLFCCGIGTADLVATFGIVGSRAGCECLDGVTVTLTYNAGVGYWEGSTSVSCGINDTLYVAFDCNQAIMTMDPSFLLSVKCAPAGTSPDAPTIPQESFTCSPFRVAWGESTGIAFIDCCIPSPLSGIKVIVTLASPFAMRRPVARFGPRKRIRLVRKDRTQEPLPKPRSVREPLKVL